MTPKTLDATPEKRIFLSIISEYDLKRSLCELIDNAIDLWSKGKRGTLEIKIMLDEVQKTISIEDNAGGVEESKLDYVISPGKTSNEVYDDVIGYFGVGSKRAVVALAEDISIQSRFKNEKTFGVNFGEYWITQDPSWELPYVESHAQLPPNTTLIELSKLRVPLESADIASIKTHLSEVYSRFLKKGIIIKVNDDRIRSVDFDNQWSYPPKLHPVRFIGAIPVEKDRKVNVEILSGLIDHPGDPDDSYGVFLYCNDRLIARGLKDFSVGFSSGMVGNPHYNISLVRTVVSIKGQSRDMPWDSSKSGINAKHVVFVALRQSIIDAAKRFAQVSRSLQGRWGSAVFPFKTGQITTEKLDAITNIPKSYLPTPPASKQKKEQKIKNLNSRIVRKKPWTEGLIDSIMAVEVLYHRTSLNQKNRLCLIILDSTVEIAYKEYLLNEKGMGLNRFKGIADNRAEIEKEVAKHIKTIDFQKVNFYYKLRCDLIHQRATPNILDDQVTDLRSIVEDMLQEMFGIHWDIPA